MERPSRQLNAFPCRACGGTLLVHDEGQRELVCPLCETTMKVPRRLREDFDMGKKLPFDADGELQRAIDEAVERRYAAPELPRWVFLALALLGAGLGATAWASPSSSSVVFPIAETTTTTSCPRSRVATTLAATRWIFSTSATELPPYFCTTMLMAHRYAIARIGVEYLRATLSRQRPGALVYRTRERAGQGGRRGGGRAGPRRLRRTLRRARALPR